MSTDDIINTYSYIYDTNWKDQLINYNGNTITYDEIGNPLTYGNNITYTWINGRELSTYTDTSENLEVTYSYNDEGIRTSKIINGVEHKYYLEGTNIIYETIGEDTLYYFYDNTGSIEGFKYNNDLYYYIKNGQNDIIGIIDEQGNNIVSYTYDSWGQVISITDNQDNEITDSTHIGNINPFRYRSYYYDSDSGLYYLNSRYYNPEIGRFINADGNGGANKDILSQNLYSYCSNNQIRFSDPSGKGLFDWLVDFMESVFDYSAKKTTKGTSIKIESPIRNKRSVKTNKTTYEIVNIIANSKISYNVGISGGIPNTPIYGSISYGGTISPNLGINKNNITIESGLSIGKGLPFLPIVPTESFSFKPGYKSPNVVYESGFGFTSTFGAGIYYNPLDRYGFSISPSASFDIGASYIWEWDRK
ncbi:MAG: hypothetical protein PHS24_05145 [Bacilli bacterium]|nr:hypothetical protein [Bacilli bacterium]